MSKTEMDQSIIQGNEPEVEEIQYDMAASFSLFGSVVVALPSRKEGLLSQGGGSGGGGEEEVGGSDSDEEEDDEHEEEEHEEEDFIGFEDEDQDKEAEEEKQELESTAGGAVTPAGKTGGGKSVANSPIPVDGTPGSTARPGSESGEVMRTPGSGGLMTDQLPPWISRPAWQRILAIRSPLLRLHQEMVDFTRYMSPTESETAAREGAIGRIREVVMSIWPHAKLEVFGSYATGLYLPSSDIDAVLLESECAKPVEGLKALANALTRKNLAKRIQVIGKARVPIVKFEEVETGLQFDISFDVANGPAAASWVLEQMNNLVALKPIALVLKVFLQQRELNEVYTGGIGSYALLTMVIAHLHLHPSRFTNRAQKLDDNLGVLLLDFLELYGRKLNNMEVGVTVRDGGLFYKKRQCGMFNVDRPFLFSIEDPQDKANDIARSSYNSTKVRSAFDFAYQSIVAAEDQTSDIAGSLLGRLVRMDEVLCGRPCPEPPLIMTFPGGEEGELPDEDTDSPEPLPPGVARFPPGLGHDANAKKSSASGHNSSGKSKAKKRDNKEFIEERNRHYSEENDRKSPGSKKQRRSEKERVQEDNRERGFSGGRPRADGGVRRIDVGKHGQRHIKFG